MIRHMKLSEDVSTENPVDNQPSVLEELKKVREENAELKELLITIIKNIPVSTAKE